MATIGTVLLTLGFIDKPYDALEYFILIYRNQVNLHKLKIIAKPAICSPHTAINLTNFFSVHIIFFRKFICLTKITIPVIFKGGFYNVKIIITDY